MYVCLCAALTEHDIRSRLQKGETLQELKRHTGAGDNCGSCDAYLRALARRYSATRRDKRRAG